MKLCYAANPNILFGTSDSKEPYKYFSNKHTKEVRKEVDQYPKRLPWLTTFSVKQKRTGSQCVQRESRDDEAFFSGTDSGFWELPL